MMRLCDRGIGVRAFDEILRNSGSGGIAKEARRIGIRRQEVYNWRISTAPNTFSIQALALAGYDVYYILTGRRKVDDVGEDNLLSEVRLMPGTPAGRSADVLCPFYRKNKGMMIGCEGITDECSIHLNFQNQNACMQQMDIFCCSRYKNCEIFEAVMKAKYADEL